MDSVAFYNNNANAHHSFYPARHLNDQPYSIPNDEQLPYVSSPASINPLPDYSTQPKHLTLPSIGQTRCYWALLDRSLQFLTVDPVLAYHLGNGLHNFLDARLLDFVHPEERESARSDLGSVLEERTLHGSVTRVRYCRLSHIRRLMGVCDEQPPFPPTFPADRVAIDDQYMAVYLVVNCIAEGLVLCFIHAAVDLSPYADNDEHNKTGWTNWCSTYGFGEQQARMLYERLCETVMPTCIVSPAGPDQSLRVFQILKNTPARTPILSWPPESLVYQQGYVSPSVDVLARLSQYVQIGSSLPSAPTSDARTSCTRRFKSVQAVDVQTSGGLKTVQVASIFIPHGMIIFVCHKIEGGFLDSPPTSTSTVSSSSLETPVHQHPQSRASNQVQPGHLNLHQLSQIASQEAQAVVNPHDPRASYGRFPYIQQWVNESHDPSAAPPVQDLWVKSTFSQHPHVQQHQQQQQQQQQQWNTYATPETPSSCSSSNMNTKGDLHWDHQPLTPYGSGGVGTGNVLDAHSHSQAHVPPPPHHHHLNPQQDTSPNSSVYYGNGRPGSSPSLSNPPDSAPGSGHGLNGVATSTTNAATTNSGPVASTSTVNTISVNPNVNASTPGPFAYHDQWSAPPQTWDTTGPTGYLQHHQQQQSFVRDHNGHHPTSNPSSATDLYTNSPSDPGPPHPLSSSLFTTSPADRGTPGLNGHGPSPGPGNNGNVNLLMGGLNGLNGTSPHTAGPSGRSASKKASRHSLKDGSSHSHHSSSPGPVGSNSGSVVGGSGNGGGGGGSKSGRKGKGLGREPYTTVGRAEGKPPPGVTKCSSCSTTASPEWRKGPSGKKELCNACGLRFARSRAKKGVKNASNSPS